ncbi:MAG: MCE family protein [Victivallales bacterium]|nr:MCE family protein [Victivallales bacterium]
MSKKVNPSAIGLFVIGAVTLLVIGLMIFGRGNLFEQKEYYQIFFDKSVNGLSIGSPVMFRGIRIGQVTDIRLALKVMEENAAERNQWPIQVTIKLLPKSFSMAESDSGVNVQQIFHSLNPGESKEGMNNWLRNMVLNKGLRAQLQTQSLLTGMLHIEFDLFANEIATDKIKKDFDNGIIPSRISAFERLYLSINQKDFSANVENFHTAINIIGEFFQSGKAQNFVDNIVATSENVKTASQDMRDMFYTLRTHEKGQMDNSAAAQLCELLADMQAVAGKINAIMDSFQQKLPRMMDDAGATLATLNKTSSDVAPKLDEAIAEARQLIKTAEKTIALAEGRPSELAQSLQETLDATRAVMTAAQATLQRMDATIDNDSPLRAEIAKAIEETRQTVQSFRSLVDLIQRNPEILIQGRRD